MEIQEILKQLKTEVEPNSFSMVKWKLEDDNLDDNSEEYVFNLWCEVMDPENSDDHDKDICVSINMELEPENNVVWYSIYRSYFAELCNDPDELDIMLNIYYLEELQKKLEEIRTLLKANKLEFRPIKER